MLHNLMNVNIVLQNILSSETSCGGDIEYVIRTTAYFAPGKKDAETIEDYETVGTWQLFKGLTMTGPLYPLTTGNLRGKKIKIGTVSVSIDQFQIFYIIFYCPY